MSYKVIDIIGTENLESALNEACEEGYHLVSHKWQGHHHIVVMARPGSAYERVDLAEGSAV